METLFFLKEFETVKIWFAFFRLCIELCNIKVVLVLFYLESIQTQRVWMSANLDAWNENDNGGQKDTKGCLGWRCTIAKVIGAVADLLSSTEPWTLIASACVVACDGCARSDDSGVGGHCKKFKN